MAFWSNWSGGRKPPTAAPRASLQGAGGGLVGRQHGDTERQEMFRVAGDDGEFMRRGDTGDHSIGHAGVVTGRKRLCFQPPADCGSLSVETDDLVIICGDETAEPCFQASGFGRCFLVIEKRTPLLDFVDGDDRQG